MAPCAGEQVGQPGVILYGPPPQTNINQPYEPAACRAQIDTDCPITAHEASDQHANGAAQKAANTRGSPAHRKGKNRPAKFIAEAEAASKALKTRPTEAGGQAATDCGLKGQTAFTFELSPSG